MQILTLSLFIVIIFNESFPTFAQKCRVTKTTTTSETCEEIPEIENIPTSQTTRGKKGPRGFFFRKLIILLKTVVKVFSILIIS